MESKRQLQVANLIKQGLSDVFQREGPNFYGKAFVTIYDIKMTPDLLLARIYISVYNTDKQETLELIKSKHYNIKKSLVSRIKNKLRQMPELEFYLDDTLDEVFKMENILGGLDIKPEDKSEEE